MVMKNELRLVGDPQQASLRRGSAAAVGRLVRLPICRLLVCLCRSRLFPPMPSKGLAEDEGKDDAGVTIHLDRLRICSDLAP